MSKKELNWLRSLNKKKGRRQEKMYPAEGVRLLEEALASGCLPEKIYFAPSSLTERGKKLIESYQKAQVETISIPARQLDAVTDTKHSQGILGVFAIKTGDPEKQLTAGHRKILVCDRIKDPGNLGTLMRSAAAFSFNLLITTADSAETTNPKTIRGSMGSFFRLAIAENQSVSGLIATLRQNNYRILVAAGGREKAHNKLNETDSLALVIGSEAEGVDPLWEQEADAVLSIPTTVAVESLNAAVAGSILMNRFYKSGREN